MAGTEARALRRRQRRSTGGVENQRLGRHFFRRSQLEEKRWQLARKSERLYFWIKQEEKCKLLSTCFPIEAASVIWLSSVGSIVFSIQWNVEKGKERKGKELDLVRLSPVVPSDRSMLPNKALFSIQTNPGPNRWRVCVITIKSIPNPRGPEATQRRAWVLTSRKKGNPANSYAGFKAAERPSHLLGICSFLCWIGSCHLSLPRGFDVAAAVTETSTKAFISALTSVPYLTSGEENCSLYCHFPSCFLPKQTRESKLWNSERNHNVELSFQEFLTLVNFSTQLGQTSCVQKLLAFLEFLSYRGKEWHNGATTT